METKQTKTRSPRLMAHRGIPWDWPENSLLSFRKALEKGPDILEFDVRLSRDGVPVIMHDETLDRTTDSKGLIGKLTLEEIRKARITFTKSGNPKPGEPIPTLEETIVLLRDFPHVLVNCEIKDYSDECIKKTIDAFRAGGILDRTYFSCFDYGVLERIKALDPAFKVQGFPLKLMKGVPDKPDAEQLFNYIGLPFKDAAKEMVDAYKAMGLITGVWVVNNHEDLEACTRLGLDLVTTDRLDIFCK